MQVECKGDRNNSLSKAFKTSVQVLRNYILQIQLRAFKRCLGLKGLIIGGFFLVCMSNLKCLFPTLVQLKNKVLLLSGFYQALGSRLLHFSTPQNARETSCLCFTHVAMYRPSCLLVFVKHVAYLKMCRVIIGKSFIILSLTPYSRYL